MTLKPMYSRNIKLKNIFALSTLFITTLLIASCDTPFNCTNNHTVYGSGIKQTVAKQLPAFKHVEVEGRIKLTLNVNDAKKHGMTIRGDDNIIPLIKIAVQDEILIIKKLKPAPNISRSTLIVTIDTPSLESLQMTGACSAQIEAVKGNTFAASIYGAGQIDIASVQTSHLNFKVEGAGKIKVDNINTKTTDIQLDGAAKATLSGNTKQLDCSLNGVGSIMAQKLLAQDVTVEINGIGKAKVYASNSLNAKQGGMSRIDYYGHPDTVVTTGLKQRIVER
jgi:hypothetical protein